MSRDSFDVKIEKIVAGGDGLARREDGSVVFVPGTVPGETHLVTVSEKKKDYLRAESSSCLEPSEKRRTPPCPYAGRCGGCSLMHLSKEAQIEAKRAIVLESLERAGVQGVGTLATTTSPEAGYRTRLRFHVSHGENGISMGFHRRSSHEVVDIENCYLASSSLNGAWAAVREWVRREPERARGLVSIELQESSHEPGRIVARFLVQSRDGIRRFERKGPEELLRESTLEGVVAETERGGAGSGWGKPVLRHVVGALSLRQSPGSFFQANRFLLEELVEAAAPLSRVSRLVDLYCGVGLFSLGLSSRAGAVLGVEGSRPSVRDARANARSAGVERARFVQDDVLRFARRPLLARGDYVVLDPPRGGLPLSLKEALVRSPIGAFSYVSCDAPALGRDAAWLSRRGFRIETLQLLDLFPNTHHFETVVRWSR